MLRVLGTIPGPLLFGFVLDKACMLSGVSCGHQGSCNVYSNEQISRNMLILALLLKVSAILLSPPKQLLINFETADRQSVTH